jgi:hypothetical protein
MMGLGQGSSVDTHGSATVSTAMAGVSADVASSKTPDIHVCCMRTA